MKIAKKYKLRNTNIFEENHEYENKSSLMSFIKSRCQTYNYF